MAHPPGDAFIHMRDVSLSFPLYRGGARSLKKTLLSRASRKLPLSRGYKTGANVALDDTRIEVQALRNITLDIVSGERVGLIGHNGAGKSTLLRAMLGIYAPNSGHIQTHGTIEALLDPATGMNPELTGRENIALRALQIGYTPRQLRTLEEDVIDFAGLDEFIDLPVRLYSSGMTIRLGFGLTTAISPQILLMDEWFLAGDNSFQEKARKRLEQVVHKANILVLTSHSLSTIEQWCTRVIWMEAGCVRAEGKAEVIVQEYLANMRDIPAP